MEPPWHDSIRRAAAGAAAQPRGRGDDREDLVDRGHRRVGDRPRRDPRGAAAAARADASRSRASGSRPSTWAPASRCSARVGSACGRGTGRVEGEYALFMPMTTEQATVGGRETFGEPKKIGAVSIDVDGERHPRPLRAHGLPARRGAGHARRADRHPAARQGRLLLQVQPVARRQGLRHRARARARTPARRGARRSGDRRHAHAARLAARPDRRHPGRARSCRCSSRRSRPPRRARWSSACPPTGSCRTCTSATTTSRCSGRRTERDERPLHDHLRRRARRACRARSTGRTSTRGTTRRSTSSSPNAKRTATCR